MEICINISLIYLPLGNETAIDESVMWSYSGNPPIVAHAYYTYPDLSIGIKFYPNVD